MSEQTGLALPQTMDRYGEGPAPGRCGREPSGWAGELPACPRLPAGSVRAARGVCGAAGGAAVGGCWRGAEAGQGLGRRRAPVSLFGFSKVWWSGRSRASSVVSQRKAPRAAVRVWKDRSGGVWADPGSGDSGGGLHCRRQAGFCGSRRYCRYGKH